MGRVRTILGVTTAGIATGWTAWQSFRLGRASKSNASKSKPKK
jgi:hypothetical protein